MTQIVTELETALAYQGYSGSPLPGLSDVGSSASPKQSVTEFDDQKRSMTADFAEHLAEERRSWTQLVDGMPKPEAPHLSTANTEPSFVKEFEHLRFGLELIEPCNCTQISRGFLD
ncbi:hypothetical protein L2E82_48416 [Cichorium intybus]|uniref:Uncharacterized protein n=1 Tax=Cichorium intybus TaxID=13427 RepID=A0ACB8YY03_CICIN|nr:hypothetical protein L2E82_48416 [Cichorium intybus]